MPMTTLFTFFSLKFLSFDRGSREVSFMDLSDFFSRESFSLGKR